jgi:hypothetical protein
MLDYQRIWQLNHQDKLKSRKNNKNFIYSYRVSSVPLQKDIQLKVTALKKQLSPVPSLKSPKQSSIYSFNRTSIFTQAHLLQNEKNEKIRLMPTSPQSKIRWAEKHFSCYQQSHVRARSIQNDYQRVKERKASMLNTCEISLQTFN